MRLEKIVDNAKNFIAGLAVAVCVNGCASSPRQNRWESDAAMYALPANIAASYFGGLGTHESGHALTAALLGANSIDVTVLPSRNSYFGRTSYERAKPFEDWEESMLNISGPGINLVAGIASRELLNSSEVPVIFQPTLQWYALGNKGAFYWNAIRGIMRVKNADLGKEEIWVPATMLGVGLMYDLFDIFVRDSPSRYFGVLIGNSFYESEDSNLSFEFSSTSRENYVGLRLDW